MKKLFALLVFISFTNHCVAEPCPLKNLSDYDYSDLECNFYLGTLAYRHSNYSVAAAHWQYVVDSKPKHEGDIPLQAMALSTVTFLTYQGLGVPLDRDKAVKAWIEAAKKGSIEARRHLGYAYSDNEYNGKDLVKSLGWYKSITLIYPNLSSVPEDDKEIYNDALDGVRSIQAKLSKQEYKEAIDFAKQTIDISIKQLE